MKIDYLRGLSTLKNDPKFTEKLLVGSLLVLSTMIIPLVGQLVLIGWQAMIMRRVATHQPGLPRLDFDTDYLGKLVGVGFKGMIARFVWSIPLALLMVFIMCTVMGLQVAVLGSSAGRDFAGILPFCMCGAQLIILPLVLLVTLPAAVASMRAELSDDLKLSWKHKEVLQFTKEMLKPLLFGTLIIGCVGALMTMVGMMACGLGVFPAVVAISVAQADMMGQIYLAGLEKGLPEIPVGPDISPLTQTAPATF